MAEQLLSDRKACDVLAAWLADVDEEGQWGDAADFIAHAADVLGCTGRDVGTSVSFSEWPAVSSGAFGGAVDVERVASVAVRTRYLGPTDHRGARVKAWRADVTYSDDPQAVTIPYDYGLNVADAHGAAVVAYLEGHERAGHGWGGRWVVGAAADGYVAVRADR